LLANWRIEAMARPVILIPVKPFARAKSRLAGVLDGAAREALARRLFGHVLRQSLDARADVLVVSRDEEALSQARSAGAMALRETCEGHNPALAQALLKLDRMARAPVLIVSSDLPLLSAQDLRVMLAPPVGVSVMIATDTAGQGTNALYLAHPAILALRFGPGSRAAHEREARRAGLGCRVIRREGLACDLDMPADLPILLSRA
jgi:2-phospho-L-lactate guanylyltransferase